MSPTIYRAEQIKTRAIPTKVENVVICVKRKELVATARATVMAPTHLMMMLGSVSPVERRYPCSARGAAAEGSKRADVECLGPMGGDGAARKEVEPGGGGPEAAALGTPPDD